jgi:hypothetical protein
VKKYAAGISGRHPGFFYLPFYARARGWVRTDSAEENSQAGLVCGLGSGWLNCVSQPPAPDRTCRSTTLAHVSNTPIAPPPPPPNLYSPVTPQARTEIGSFLGIPLRQHGAELGSKPTWAAIDSIPAFWPSAACRTGYSWGTNGWQDPRKKSRSRTVSARRLLGIRLLRAARAARKAAEPRCLRL